MRSITDLLTSFVKSSNAKDAKVIGELFTPEAEIEDEDGDVTRGRDAIIAHFAETWAGGETGTLSVDTESLRFLETDLAIKEGTASLSIGTDSPPRTNRYGVDPTVVSPAANWRWRPGPSAINSRSPQSGSRRRECNEWYDGGRGVPGNPGSAGDRGPDSPE